ncbi:MAG: HAD-IA family hydrolase [Pseudomonadota bacterium]
MLKALFLDMDQTLCDTAGANRYATEQMEQALTRMFGAQLDARALAAEYVSGIYRRWSNEQRARYMPMIEERGENGFRLQLIRDLLAARSIVKVSDDDVKQLQDGFDTNRLTAFDFYPGIKEFLAEARKLFTLVVITNGPEYSQIPKVEAVRLKDHVDHIIIGGQEPEQKPARSIFEKALKLAQCEAHEAIHVGDSLAADVAGAQNSAITSVWIQHQQPLDAELGIDPHHTVMHPSEIPALIQELHSL